MLKPFGPEDAPQALMLLDEGFPERGRDFWEQGLARLFAWSGNRQAHFPPGFFWHEKDEPAGIVLTPASLRQPDGDSQTMIVNVSSWYMREKHRWKAPLMLRALFRDDRAIFTDLTPTPDVQKMLPNFGFTPVSEGIEWIGTPLEALRPAGDHLRHWQPGDILAPGSPSDALIAEHLAWGAMAVVIERAETLHLVVLKRMRARGLPGARLLFAHSHAVLQEALPVLSRFLLRRGILVLNIHARPAERRGRGYRPHGIWFARGNAFHDRTDHFGSELALFDF